MLAKFKIEAGAAFTTAAEGMMKDVKISEEMQGAFKRWQDKPANIVRLSFDVFIDH
jgi:cullin 3